MDDLKWPLLKYDPHQQNIQLPQKPFHINIQEIIEAIPSEILTPTLTKYPLITSNNAKSTPFSRIRAQYDQWDELGDWLNKNTRPKQEFIFKMSSPLPMPIDLRTALLSMSMGDEAWFKVIRNDKIIFYRIKVLEIRLIQVDNSSLQGRMQQLDSFRQIGKGYFSQEMYRLSIKSYRKGLNYLEKWPKSSKEDNECRIRRKEFYLIFWGNIAQCHIEMQEFKQAIHILTDLVEQTRNSVIYNINIGL